MKHIEGRLVALSKACKRKEYTMPKRIGYVWEELISIEHCEKSVLTAIRNKRKTSYLNHVKNNHKEYGYKLQQTIINGWEPQTPRQKTICEGSRKKTRELKIPSLKDHFVHTAVAKILEKHLSKRFYFYACGSLPNKGQTFATKALEANLRKKKPKYCAVADVRKCYQSIKKEQVMLCLRRVFKDEKFLAINEKILDQMGDGLAIGFAVSHWYAQLVLSFVDKAIKDNFPKVFVVRFMDNYVFTCGRKRTLHKVIRFLDAKLAELDLELKDDWQVFPLRSRMVEFLSYRMDHNNTILRKGLMYRMTKFLRRTKGNVDAHKARIVMSFRGILKHCDSYNFRMKYLYPNVSIRLCRRLISDADQKRILHAGTR